jgi:hypothetical protein
MLEMGAAPQFSLSSAAAHRRQSLLHWEREEEEEYEEEGVRLYYHSISQMRFGLVRPVRRSLLR